MSAVACAFVWSAASFKSKPVQKAAPAPRKMRIRSRGSSDATLIAATSSLNNWIDNALRRSGRFSVKTVTCGECFSMRTTGIGDDLVYADCGEANVALLSYSASNLHEGIGQDYRVPARRVAGIEA